MQPYNMSQKTVCYNIYMKVLKGSEVLPVVSYEQLQATFGKRLGVCVVV